MTLRLNGNDYRRCKCCGGKGWIKPADTVAVRTGPSAGNQDGVVMVYNGPRVPCPQCAGKGVFAK